MSLSPRHAAFKRRIGSTRSKAWRVARGAGVGRVTFLLQRLAEHASHLGVLPAEHPYSLHQNTIALEDQPAYPGALEQARCRALVEADIDSACKATFSSR